jgi:hypothetical protein
MKLNFEIPKLESTDHLTVSDLDRAIEAVKATNKTLKEINQLFEERISSMRSEMTPEDFADCARPSKRSNREIDEPKRSVTFSNGLKVYSLASNMEETLREVAKDLGLADEDSSKYGRI